MKGVKNVKKGKYFIFLISIVIAITIIISLLVKTSGKDKKDMVNVDPRINIEITGNVSYEKQESVNQALLCLDHQEYKKAEELLLSLTKEKNPPWFEARIYLSLAYVYGYCPEKRYDEAIQAIKKVLEIGKDDPEAWGILGMIYYLKGEIPKSIDSLEKARKINPEYLPALSFLVGVLIEKGKKEDLQQAEEIIRLITTSGSKLSDIATVPNTYINWAKLCIVRKDYPQALEKINLGLDAFKKYPRPPSKQKIPLKVPFIVGQTYVNASDACELIYNKTGEIKYHRRAIQILIEGKKINPSNPIIVQALNDRLKK